MSSISLFINGEKTSVQAAADTPILWVLREQLGLTGTKYSCGRAVCGSCTIHVDGSPVRACVTAVGDMEGKRITTIEGLAKDGLHPLQEAWIKAQVPQCGYCQSGQIMQAASLLETNSAPTREEIAAHMRGNLCRCGAYMRIFTAIESLTQNEES